METRGPQVKQSNIAYDISLYVRTVLSRYNNYFPRSIIPILTVLNRYNIYFPVSVIPTLYFHINNTHVQIMYLVVYYIVELTRRFKYTVAAKSSSYLSLVKVYSCNKH